MDSTASTSPTSSQASTASTTSWRETWKEEKLRQTTDTLNEIRTSVRSLEERIDNLNSRIVVLRSIGNYESAKECIREKWRRACQLQSMELTLQALVQAKELLEIGKCLEDDMDPVNQITKDLQRNLTLLIEDNVSGRRG